MTVEDKSNNAGGNFGPLNSDNSLGHSALDNEDPRIMRVKGLISGLRQNKVEMEARYALAGKNARKGGGLDPEKIRLAQERDDMLTDLIGEALGALDEPASAVEFSIDRDPLRPIRNIRINVGIEEQDYSYSVPIVGIGRDFEMQSLVEKAVAVADSKSEEAYYWDKDNVVKKGSEEERAGFIINTINYLDFLGKKLKEANPQDVSDAIGTVWDSLAIGRLIHMNVLDRVPTNLGYNITVSLSEKSDRKGLQVIVVVPQNRVGRRESNVRTFKVLFNEDRDKTLNDIVVMARGLIDQNAGHIRAAQPPAKI